MENTKETAGKTASQYGIIDLVTREVRPDDLMNPSDKYLGHIYTVRTSAWRYVVSLTYNLKMKPPVKMESTPDQPIYICDSYRLFDSKKRPKFLVLRPAHPKKNCRFFFVDK